MGGGAELQQELAPDVLELLREQAAAAAADFRPADMALLLLGLAIMKKAAGPRLEEALFARAAATADAFQLPDVVGMLWSVTTLQARPGPYRSALLSRLSVRAVAMANSMGISDVQTIRWAATTLGIDGDEPELMAAIGRRSEQLQLGF